MHRTGEPAGSTTGTVEWFDVERCVGAIRPDDDAAPCEVESDTLRACGIPSPAAGDRVRFRLRDEEGRRTATDLSLLRAMQRWENEGGAPDPDEA